MQDFYSLMNKSQRRQLKRRRVLFASLRSDQLAEWNPETQQVEVTELRGRDNRFTTPHLIKSPTLAELHKVVPGSAAEKAIADIRMRQGLPRYDDRKTGTVLG